MHILSLMENEKKMPLFIIVFQNLKKIKRSKKFPFFAFE